MIFNKTHFIKQLIKKVNIGVRTKNQTLVHKPANKYAL